MWQPYRAEYSETQPDGAEVWRSRWQWGTPLAKIVKCRLVNLEGDMRRTVHATGEPDTFFSIPAVCYIGRKRVRGYVTGDDNSNLVFRQTYY